MADGAGIPLHLGLATPFGPRNSVPCGGSCTAVFILKDKQNENNEKENSLSFTGFFLIVSFYVCVCVCVCEIWIGVGKAYFSFFLDYCLHFDENVVSFIWDLSPKCDYREVWVWIEYVDA